MSDDNASKHTENSESSEATTMVEVEQKLKQQDLSNAQINRPNGTLNKACVEEENTSQFEVSLFLSSFFVYFRNYPFLRHYCDCDFSEATVLVNDMRLSLFYGFLFILNGCTAITLVKL